MGPRGPRAYGLRPRLWLLKVRMTCCIFLEGTLFILITYHLRNELKKQKKCISL